MHARGTRVALAMLTGVAFAGVLAGCATGTATMSPAALKQLQAAEAARNAQKSADPAPADATPTDAATGNAGDATSAPTSAPTSKPTDKPASTGTHTSTPKPTSSPSSTPTPTPPPSAADVYADGTYSATGSYQSPGGWEKLRVTLTLSDDIIRSVDVESVKVDPTAANYQAQFAAGIGSVVVGKDIDEISVGAVAGSSLTANGFNSALAKIRSAAHN